MQAAAASEAELRHMLRRRDRRIEELKREQLAIDRMARSTATTGGGGTPSLALAGSHPTSDRCESSEYGPVIVALGGSTSQSSGRPRSTAERAEKEVSQAATVLRLQLELAEASARGDVGGASTRAAERLARRVLPQTDGFDNGNGEVWTGGECSLCGQPLVGRDRGRRSMKRSLNSVSQAEGRGASFLMPSAEMEHKARGVSTEAIAQDTGTPKVPEATVEQLGHAPTDDTVGDTPVEHPADEAVGSQGGGNTPGRQMISATGGGFSELEPSHTSSNQRATPPNNSGTAARSCSSPQGLSSGVRSLEAQLARLADEGRAKVFPPGADSSGSADVFGGDNGRLQSRSPAERTDTHGSTSTAWVDALRELKVQVAGLRDRAEFAEKIIAVS